MIRVCAIFIVLLISNWAHALPDSFTEKADQISNICQSCFPEIIQWGGKPHCAPAAVSNSLVWLSHNGFETLQPFHSQDAQRDQARLVDLLGRTMETTQNGGTTPFKVLSGLKTYLDKQGVKYKRLAATGWRTVPAFAQLDSPKTTLSWIQEGTLEKNSVWILIGWSKYDPQKDNYKIYDGHWMTVVGYGKNRQGSTDPNILIIHDPAERSERKNYYATIAELKQGVINDSIPAQGVLTISGDVIMKPGAQFGLIQGAYRLDM
jgi:hypothetical protein